MFALAPCTHHTATHNMSRGPCTGVAPTTPHLLQALEMVSFQGIATTTTLLTSTPSLSRVSINRRIIIGADRMKQTNTRRVSRGVGGLSGLGFSCPACNVSTDRGVYNHRAPPTYPSRQVLEVVSIEVVFKEASHVQTRLQHAAVVIRHHVVLRGVQRKRAADLVTETLRFRKAERLEEAAAGGKHQRRVSYTRDATSAASNPPVLPLARCLRP